MYLDDDEDSAYDDLFPPGFSPKDLNTPGYEDDYIKVNEDGSVTGKPLKPVFIYEDDSIPV